MAGSDGVDAPSDGIDVPRWRGWPHSGDAVIGQPGRRSRSRPDDLSDLVATIDSQRQHSNLSYALRLFVLVPRHRGFDRLDVCLQDDAARSRLRTIWCTDMLSQLACLGT
jgi:hypothetical protein